MAKSFWDKEELITSVEKNKSENIQVKHCEKNDKTYIDIRISKVDKEGEYHPTSNGVAIPYNSYEEMVKEINHFLERLKGDK